MYRLHTEISLLLVLLGKACNFFFFFFKLPPFCFGTFFVLFPDYKKNKKRKVSSQRETEGAEGGGK